MQKKNPVRHVVYGGSLSVLVHEGQSPITGGGTPGVLIEICADRESAVIAYKGEFSGGDHKGFDGIIVACFRAFCIKGRLSVR